MTDRVMARRRSHPDRVADALRQVVLRIDPDRRLAAYRVWTFWADAVGPAVAGHAEPANFRDGVLSVRVSGAAWMQELQFMKEALREQLNTRLGRALIRDIYFVSGAVTAPPPRRAPPAPRADDAEPPVALPPLKDPRLAEVLARLTRAARTRGRR
jgi:predicted nucleic acid-binding Zn ribbon protein